jgi:hypothetical protein
MAPATKADFLRADVGAVLSGVERSPVSTSLELVPDGQGWAVAFRLKNTTATELTGQVFEPFVLFTLEVTSLEPGRVRCMDHARNEQSGCQGYLVVRSPGPTLSIGRGILRRVGRLAATG